MLLIDEITLQGGYDVTIVKVAGSTCTISCRLCCSRTGLLVLV